MKPKHARLIPWLPRPLIVLVLVMYAVVLVLAVCGCAEFREPELSRWNPPVPNASYPCDDARPWVRHDPDTGEIYCTVRPYDMQDHDVDVMTVW